MSDNDRWVLFHKTLDFLRIRKRSYQFTFGQVEHSEALKDLAKFCRIGKAPYHPDKRKNDILIGRQEVFFRITEHLRLQPDQLFDLYNTPPNQQHQIKE